MKTHQEIDMRSLALNRAIVEKIDGDLEVRGLWKARCLCERWMRENPRSIVAEWMRLLEQDWPAVRKILIEPSPECQRLRQNSPFCGILSPSERWAIYKEFSHHETGGT